MTLGSFLFDTDDRSGIFKGPCWPFSVGKEVSDLLPERRLRLAQPNIESFGKAWLALFATDRCTGTGSVVLHR
jgi:hypothetical protein